jgi:short-subunit dehydrogenase
LKAVANDIERHYNVKVKILQTDLSTPDCAKRVYDATKGLHVDILVNNAGVCTHGDFVDGDSVDVTNMMSINIGAVTHLSQLYGRDMKERRRGRILIVSSISGALPGNPKVAVYAATKAYVKSFSLALEAELEENENNKAKVICICPGVTETEFCANANANPLGLPEGFIASSEEVAKFTLDILKEGKGGIAVHGKMNSALALLSRVLPANLSNAVSLYIMKKLSRQSLLNKINTLHIYFH